ncbi:MAG: hypothetical protein WBL65_05425 [Bryobacteraceae bacterium]
MLTSLWIAVLLATQAGKPALKTLDPRPALAAPKPLATANFSAYATPSPISFAATDPDSPLVAGSATTTVSWTTGATPANDPWTLQVYSVATSFTNCPTVPISAVTITCTAGFNPGPGGFACGAPATLSTSKTTVASGTLPYSGSSTSFWMTLTYTLTDKWKYAAQMSPSCTLNITYLATVN